MNRNKLLKSVVCEVPPDMDEHLIPLFKTAFFLGIEATFNAIEKENSNEVELNDQYNFPFYCDIN